MPLPRARQEDLIVERLADEVLVYDLQNHQAHCLNQATGLVWTYCDGKTTLTRMVQLLEEQSQTELDEEVVWLALEQLAKFKLLAGPWARPAGTRSISRRELALKYAPAALVLPAIMSITSPAAAQAASDPCTRPDNRPDGCPCTADGDCASQNCNVGICGPML